MGKKMNDRRKRIFAELKQSGQIQQPLYMGRRDRTRVKREPVPVVEQPEMKRFECCLVKYKDDIPNGFRMCIDCPGP